MKDRWIYLASFMTLVSVACFRPHLECGDCGPNGSCPSGLTCGQSGFCVTTDNVASDKSVCSGSPAALARGDAAASLSDASTAESSLDLEGPDTIATGGPDGAPDVPSLMCSDRCCINGSCLDIPEHWRQGLLLWADRTSLGQPGSTLQTWLDRSPHSNDIVPLNMSPDVTSDEVGPVVLIHNPAMVIATKIGASIFLGTGDFTILVLARFNPGTPNCVFDQTTQGRPRTGVAIRCNRNGTPFVTGALPNRAELEVVDDDSITIPDGNFVSPRTNLSGGLHLYGARRVGQQMQLRVDGFLEGGVPIPSSTNLMDTPLFIGSCVLPPPYTDAFDGQLAAVVVVGGSMTDVEVGTLETFIHDTMGSTAPQTRTWKP